MRVALRFLAVLVSAASLGACGGSPPAESPASEAATSPSEPAAASAERAEAAAPSEAGGSADQHVPTECFKAGAMCLPDPKFVKRLCNGRYPAIALYLYSNPKWTRGYLTRRTQAWNASGGASAEGWVEFDEEVLLLYARVADTGGMQVSGAGGSYDALRWDGSCVTLQSEEVTTSKPPTPKYPSIEFRFLDDETQEALRKDDKINEAWRERRKECKGATSGDVSSKCVKADAQLTRSVIGFVRGGGSVPEPKKLP